MENSSAIFTVAVTPPDYTGGINFIYPAIDLPASPAIIRDVLDRARVSGPEQPHRVIISPCRPYESLHKLIAESSLNIMELNKLAEIVAEMEDHDVQVLEGLIKANSSEQPLTLCEIINLTSATDAVPIASRVYTDEQLGRFYYENGMLSEEEIPEGVNEKFLNFEEIGKEYREAEKGVYTHWGYVPNLLNEIPTDFTSDSVPNLDVLLAKDRMEVDVHGKDQSGQQSPILITTYLPLTDLEIDDLDRKLYEPAELVANISHMLAPIQVADGEPLDYLNQLAKFLTVFRDMGNMVLFKALLEQTKCESLPDILCVAEHIHEYTIDSEIFTASDYAQKALEQSLPHEQAVSLIQNSNMESYGEDLIRQQNVEISSYGAIWRYDHQHIPSIFDGDPYAQQLSRPEEKQTAEQLQIQMAHELGQRLDVEYKQYIRNMEQLSPAVIIDRAAEIAAMEAVHEAYHNDTGEIEDVYLERLLQFEQPLKVLADAWRQLKYHEIALELSPELGVYLDDSSFCSNYDLFSDEPDYLAQEKASSHEPNMGLLGGHDGI